MDCSRKVLSPNKQDLVSKYLLGIAKLFLMFNILLAESDWKKYGWQLYQNAGDARSIAMGGASIADNHSISALWNPAISGIESNKNLIYGHQSRFAGIIQSDLISFPFKTKNNRNFNVLFLHESVSKIPNTENLLLDWGNDGVPNTGDFGENNGYLDEGERLDNDNISYFNQHQIGIQLSTQLLYKGFDLGVSIKSLFHTLNDHFGSGIGLDVGIRRSIGDNTNIGLSIQNLIPAMVVWDSGNIELSKPKILIGMSQHLNMTKVPIHIYILSDVIFDIQVRALGDDFQIGSTSGNFRIGTEISYRNRINFRLGRSQYGFYSTGLGLSWTNFELNYGYQLNSKAIDLGTNHVLSFRINPNLVIEKLKQ